MSRFLGIACDGCSARSKSPTTRGPLMATYYALREELQKLGWVFRASDDLCPRCAKKR